MDYRSINTKDKVFDIIKKAEQVKKDDPAKALDYIEQALSYSIDNKSRSGEAYCYRSLGAINYDLEQYSLSVEYFEKAIHIFKDLGDKEGLARSYNDIGLCYEALGNYPKSLEYYNLYLREAESVKHEDRIIEAKDNIARVNLKMEKYDESLKDYQYILSQEQARNNPHGEIKANENIANVLFKQKKNEDALEYYQSSQSVAQELADSASITRSLYNISNVYRANKDYDKELEVRQQSLELNKATKNLPAQTEDNFEIANVLLEQDNASEAIPYLEKTIDLTEQTGDLENKSKAVKQLSKAYQVSGEKEKAIETYKEYVAIKETLLTKKENELMARVEMQNEINRKQQRIENLELNKQAKESEIKVLKQKELLKEQGMRTQQIIIYSLLGFVIILSVTSYLILRSSRQKRIANQLLALKSLRSQMNPHFIFNALNSVNSFISKSDERSANKYLADFSRLMRTVMESSQKDFILLSGEVQILDLYLNLEHFRFKDKFDYEFIVDESIDTDSFEVPPMLIQPYIENAIWHGLRYKEEKGNLMVRISSRNGMLEVIVEDDGIGRRRSFELKTKHQKEKESTALKNIENRLKILNDTYKVSISVSIDDKDKESGSGTVVRMVIPNCITN